MDIEKIENHIVLWTNKTVIEFINEIKTKM
jgi:hypothetical protein